MLPNVSGLPVLEVVIGLSFLFFLLSTVCSAVNEMIATWLGWRAKTLEQAIANLLGDSPAGAKGSRVPGRVTAAPAMQAQTPPDNLTEQVLDHWKIRSLVRNPDSVRRRRRRPSYLPPEAFSLAVAETLSGAASVDPSTATPWQVADEELLGYVQAALDSLPSGRPREALKKAAFEAGKDLEAFRRNVERAFDDAMERASGWYKRKVSLVLGVIAVGVTLGLNVNAAQIAERLWKDGPIRSAVVARAAASQPPADAAEAVDQIKQLRLPIGWSKPNRPRNVVGVLKDVPGWALTIAAISLGAPFWFDLLSRLARLRGSGVPERPRSLSDRPGTVAGGR